jgi:hypothetical protein
MSAVLVQIPTGVREELAKHLYYQYGEVIANEPVPPTGKPEWVPWGNSIVQTECRRRADALLNLIYDNSSMQALERSVLDRAVDRMGWEQINEFNAELKKGQDIREDAGGFFARCIRRLFGNAAPPTEVESYQSAARKMIENLHAN